MNPRLKTFQAIARARSFAGFLIIITLSGQLFPLRLWAHGFPLAPGEDTTLGEEHPGHSPEEDPETESGFLRPGPFLEGAGLLETSLDFLAEPPIEPADPGGPSGADTNFESSYEAEDMEIGGAGFYKGFGGVLLWANGALGFTSPELESGIYEIEIRAFGIEEGSELPLMRVLTDNRMAGSAIEVSNTGWNYQSYTMSGIELEAGSHRVGLEFFNDLGERGLWVDRVILRRTGALSLAPQRFVLEAEAMNVSGQSYQGAGGVLLWSAGEVRSSLQGMEAGTYEIEVQAFGVEGAGELPEMQVLAGGRVAGAPVAVKNEGWHYHSYRFSGIELGAGTNDFAVQFMNDAPVRDLWIDRILIRKTGGLAYRSLRPEVQGETMSTESSQYYMAANAQLLWGSGRLHADFENLASGVYDLEVYAFGVTASEEARMRVWADSALAADNIQVPNHNWNFAVYNAGQISLSGGSHRVDIEFLNPGFSGGLWVDKVVLRKIAEIAAPAAPAVFTLELDPAILEAARDFGLAAFTGSGDEIGGWAAEIVKKFLAGFEDSFDFLIFAPTLKAAKTLSLEDRDASGDNGVGTFYLGPFNDTEGIGDDAYDYRDSFGSGPAGDFEGLLYLDSALNSGSAFRFSTSDFAEARNERLWQNVLSQELLHRFGIFLTAEAGNPYGMLGRSFAHWGAFYDSDFSPMDGNDWSDNGNGTFTLAKSYIDESAVKRSLSAMPYHDLDLYLMGALEASEVKVGYVIDNPRLFDGRPLRPYKRSGDPGGGPYVEVQNSNGTWSGPYYMGTSLTIQGTRRAVSLQDILSLEGPRTPGFGNAPRDFKTAFIVLEDATDTALERSAMASKVQTFQKNFADFFASIARGLSTIDLPEGLPDDYRRPA